MPGKILAAMILPLLVNRMLGQIGSVCFCMFDCCIWLIGMRDPLYVLGQGISETKFLKRGECNDPHSTHHRIVGYLFLSRMKLYGHETLGDDYWGHFPCS